MSKTKFKDLTPEQKEYLRYVYHSEKTHKEKTDTLSKKFGVNERTIRKWWQNLDLKKQSYDLPPQLRKALEREINKDSKVLLITTAQNKTTLNEEFLQSLKTYQDFITNSLGKQTEIVIVPSRYRNPTSNIETEKTKSEDWWDDSVEDLLFYGKVNFGDTLISADSRISPTAKEPLLGYELLASQGHVVLGHSKIHWRTLPRLRGEALRTMCTTGYLTNKNYSKSKAGEIGFEHHSYGFVVVELKEDNTCYIPRNVKVKSDGSFTDIIYSVNKDGVEIIDSSLGFVWGDIHNEVIDESFYKVSKDLVCNKLKPKKIVAHDVLDGFAFNPHEEKDLFIKRQKIVEGKHLIDKEIENVLNRLEDMKTCAEEFYVSESNHDIFADRHINNFNWKNDLHNSPTYLKLAYIQQTIDLRKYGNILGYLIWERFGESIKYVKMGETLKIADYECGQHGDYGSNGAKGQTRGFSRINTKMIHGHTHSPMIHNNVTAVGVTCMLEQYYNRKGFSSWAHAHSIIHNNGKNQLLVFGDDYSLSGLI